MARKQLGNPPADDADAATRAFVLANKGTGGGGGTPNLAVSQSNPGLTTAGLWIQVDGTGNVVTFWVENGIGLSSNLIQSSTLRNASNPSQITAAFGTMSLDTASFYSGGSSLKFTPSSNGVYPYWYFTTPTEGAPVSAGSQYTGIVKVFTPTSAAGSMAAVLVWFKADGSALSNIAGSAITTPANTWTQISVTATAPANAAYAAVQVQTSNALNTTDTVNVDEYGIQAGTNTTWSG